MHMIVGSRFTFNRLRLHQYDTTSSTSTSPFDLCSGRLIIGQASLWFLLLQRSKGKKVNICSPHDSRFTGKNGWSLLVYSTTRTSVKTLYLSLVRAQFKSRQAARSRSYVGIWIWSGTSRRKRARWWQLVHHASSVTICAFSGLERRRSFWEDQLSHHDTTSSRQTNSHTVKMFSITLSNRQKFRIPHRLKRCQHLLSTYWIIGELVAGLMAHN